MTTPEVRYRLVVAYFSSLYLLALIIDFLLRGSSQAFDYKECVYGEDDVLTPRNCDRELPGDCDILTLSQPRDKSVCKTMLYTGFAELAIQAALIYVTFTVLIYRFDVTTLRFQVARLAFIVVFAFIVIRIRHDSDLANGPLSRSFVIETALAALYALAVNAVANDMKAGLLSPDGQQMV